MMRGKMMSPKVVSSKPETITEPPFPTTYSRYSTLYWWELVVWESGGKVVVLALDETTPSVDVLSQLVS